MARSASVSIENNFRRGLITEATGLNFPENACTSVQNCVFNHEGSISRRPGFEYETDYSLKSVDRTQSVVNVFLWDDVLGDGTKAFAVVQIGATLYFYDLDSSDLGAISQGEHASSIDLTDFSPAGAPDPDSNECQFAQGLGYLFVTHPDLDAFRIEYSSSGDSFSTTQIDPQIRDFEGSLQDSLGLTERTTSTLAALDVEHKYNLYNQGWYFEVGSSGPINDWDTARTDMPSNADIWWAFKDSNGDWANAQVARVDLGNTPAPKGHYLLSVFSPDRDTASGLSGVTDSYDAGTNRFSTCAFFAGRIWYSGLNYKGLSANVYFSQIVQSSAELSKCYQQNDPTSETASDLLPSDGGLLSITGGGTIIKLFPFQESLLVFSTKGVWAISGSQGIGFTADDYSVRKISSIPALSGTSFVDADGSPLWWNSDGIYTVAGDNLGGLTVQSLTDESIKTFYNSIPLESKRLARGAYNAVTNKVQWLYKLEEDVDPETSYEFDAILQLDTLTGSWSPWYTSSDATVALHGVIIAQTPASGVVANQVIDSSSNTVVDSSTNNVIVYGLGSSLIEPTFKYFVSVPDDSTWNATFAEANDEDYVDWTVADSGLDFDSKFTTGYRFRGDTQRFFQPNYVFVFLDQETDASCFMRAIFDFTNDPDSGKYSTKQQTYNSSLTLRDVNFRRLKVRGKGRAMQLMFESESGKPFTIQGWSIYDTANQSL